MRTFELIVEDDRNLDPAIVSVMVADEARAREHARMQLALSRHHRCVHVQEMRRRLFSLHREEMA